MRISDWSSDVCSSDLALLERPALLDRVRADRTLVPKVINEGMRWETASQFLARQATVDVEIRGVKIPAGAAVSLASGSANRDEDIFDNRSEEHTSELQSLMRNSYAVFCLKKKKITQYRLHH